LLPFACASVVLENDRVFGQNQIRMALPESVSNREVIGQG